jgi:hypothetical protein
MPHAGLLATHASYAHGHFSPTRFPSSSDLIGGLTGGKADTGWQRVLVVDGRIDQLLEPAPQRVGA